MYNKNVFAVVLAVIAATVMFGTYSATVSAAGGDLDEDLSPSSLWSSIDLPGFSFHYDTSSAGDKTNFDAGMTNSDRISHVGIVISRSATDPKLGWIYANFSGIGDPVVEMTHIRQSTSVNRHGIQYDSYASLGAYQEIVEWVGDKDGYPVYGDWLSTGYASVTLFDVTPISGHMNYFESTNEWSDNTYFYGNVRWQIEFNSMSAAEMYGSLEPTSISAAPEPATMSLLALGMAGIIARRRKRS